MDLFNKIKEKITGEKSDTEPTPEELTQYFTRNRNKQVMAQILTNNPDEIKQQEAEQPDETAT